MIVLKQVNGLKLEFVDYPDLWNFLLIFQQKINGINGNSLLNMTFIIQDNKILINRPNLIIEPYIFGYILTIP